MPPISPTNAAHRFVALDWLRTFAVASLFFYHAGLVYSAPGAYGFFVLDPAGSWVVGPLLTAVSTWRMPLMFLIAGFSAETMLRRRTAATFLRFRAKRLLPPLLMGMVLLAAPQRYVDERFRTYASENATAFAGHAVRSILGGAVPAYHLWFLVALGLFTTAAAVFRGVLRTGAPGVRPRAVALAARLAKAPAFPALLIVGALAAALLHAPPARLERALGTLPAGLTGVGLVYYGLYFVVGLALARTPGVFAPVERYRRASLALAVSASAAVAVLLMADAAGLDPLPTLHVAGRTVRLTGWLGNAAWGAAAWYGVLAALGFGARHLTRTTPALLYLRDASFAWYLLHQTIIVVLAHHTTRSDVLPPPVEYLLLVAVTFAICTVLYEFPIRRTRVGRVLFGLPERVAGAASPSALWAAHRDASRLPAEASV